jgi:hypothetical protein
MQQASSVTRDIIPDNGPKHHLRRTETSEAAEGSRDRAQLPQTRDKTRQDTLVGRGGPTHTGHTQDTREAGWVIKH